MMNRYRWISSLLVLVALLFSAVQPLLAQEEMERSGLRPDAPEYGKRGPHGVGYRPIVITIGETADDQLDGDLWYPALNPERAPEEITYEFRAKNPMLGGDGPLVGNGHALLEAPIDDSMGPYPLVVFSHGFSLNPEWYSTLAEHYASHGFIVLAPEHVEKDWSESAIAAIDRPRDIKRTLDYAEGVTAPGGDLAGQIDMENVAVVGHSFGGYTALAMAGAQLDLDAVDKRCGELPPDDPKAFLCMPMMGKDADMAARAGLDAVPEGLWPSFGDPRVGAIVPIASDAWPFDEAGLAQIMIPMMAIGGTADTGAPYEWGTELSYDYASSARKALVGFVGAEHMFVGAPCESMPWTVDLPFFGMLCLDPVWDKDRALDLAHHFSTAFLLAELKADADAAAALAPDSVNFPGIEYESTGF
jgi:predicted dienelactone hydrolase